MNALNAGANLGRGESLQSPSGKFVLTLQDDGNLVLSDGGTAVWASGTDGQGVDRLAMQEDGNAVLYAGGDAKWATGTQGNGARLELQDDRNLVLYSADNSALWASGSGQADARAPEAAAPQAAPELAAAEPAAPAAQEYVVVSGDTLSAISLRFYGDANQYMKIAEANGIANPDYIQVGQKLVIP